MNHPSKKLMHLCINEARKARVKGDYPIAALVAKGDNILSLKHTSLHFVPDPTAHAEILAIREAAGKLGSRYLENCYLYTTLEPCPMCTSAAIWAKMKGIIFGVNQKDAIKIWEKSKHNKFSWRQITISTDYVISHGVPKLRLYKNFMRKECLDLLKPFK